MIAKTAIVELLGRTPLFGTLDEAERRAVADEMREVAFDPSQVIFARGDAGREIYLVVSGRVRISVLTAEGRELSFAHAEPGAIFGEIAMLDGGVRSRRRHGRQQGQRAQPVEAGIQATDGDAPASSPTRRCASCARASAKPTSSSKPSRCIRSKGGLRASSSPPRAPSRPTATEGRVTIDLPMSQSELALLIGASRPKVNTALSVLEDSGALERSGTRITCDIEELQAIAGAE